MQLAAQVSNLSLSFDGKQVLDHASLDLNAGEIVCIWGPSGEGKSTFLRVLGGMERPSQGMVRFFGRSCDKERPSPLDSARDEVGFLFQNSALISNMTVMSNIMLPLRFRRDKMLTKRGQFNHRSWRLTPRSNTVADEMMERDLIAKTEQAMRNMLVHEYRNHFPHELSMGVQKRVALSRALALDPKVLLMDEPTSGLDFISRLSLLALISNMSQLRHVSVIIVTHDLLLPKELGAKVSIFQKGRLTSPCRFEELERGSNPFVDELLHEIESSSGEERQMEQNLTDREIFEELRRRGVEFPQQHPSTSSIF